MKSKLLLLLVILSLSTTACQNNSGTVNQTSSSMSESTSESSREKEMYDKGIETANTVSEELEVFLKNNEKLLKDVYRWNCLFTGEKEETNNRALYEQFKKGFIIRMKQKEEL